MDVCTRPSHAGRWREAPQHFLPAALAFLLLVFLNNAALPSTPGLSLSDEEETASTTPKSDYAIALETVSPGTESASFSARLTENSARSAKDVSWQVFNDEGEKLLDARSTAANLPLQPGSYRVKLELGAVSMEESFTLPEGQAVALNFVLNAGALRVLPRLGHNPAGSLSTQSRIYALNGFRAGELIAKSSRPGEVLTLPAGSYRVENRLGLGNAIAIADITVKPGIVSAMHFDHNAGAIRLAYQGGTDASISWTIMQGDAAMITNLDGREADVVLRPGSYTAVTRLGAREISTDFTVVAGQSANILIGD